MKAALMFAALLSVSCLSAFSVSAVQPTLELQPRIIGGETASSVPPWMGAVTERAPTQISYYCGASFISSRWVLTAAHCVSGRSVSTMSVYAGTGWVTSDYIFDDRYHYPVERIVIHPNYDRNVGNQFDNDIALLRVSRAYKGPVLRIMDDYSFDLVPFNSQMTLYGWGRNVRNLADSTPDFLQTANIPYQDCNSYNLGTTSNMICAGDVGTSADPGIDACAGDSGGPLLIQRDQCQAQVGIVSHGVPQCGVAAPGVYTKLSNYINWVRSYVTDLQTINCGYEEYNPQEPDIIIDLSGGSSSSVWLLLLAALCGFSCYQRRCRLD